MSQLQQAGHDPPTAESASDETRPYLVVRKPGTKVWRIIEPHQYFETTDPGHFFSWASLDHAVVEFHKGEN